MLSTLLAIAFALMSSQDSPAALEAVRLAKNALIAEASAVEDEIRTVSVTAAEWPDAALGCPASGETYAQVVTPGHHVVLRFDRKRYDVHVGAGRAVVCDYLAPRAERATPSQRVAPSPVTKEPIPMPTDEGLKALVLEARDHLAEHLEIDAEAIQLVALEEVVWPDKGLGCPKPGMRYAQVPQDGLRIEFAVDGRSYAYHSGGGRKPFLCE